VQYRILYFFYGQHVAILAHAMTKESAQVPKADIVRAKTRKQLFIKNPEVHTYKEEAADGKD
jgi:phage-related protein